ncbi:MAG: hypothetical protein QF749_04230 [Verrucomicrobiota bacterium]|nr:hypothetical protein [Verrucomicrobiota bacterium]MDP6251169.1 hypothetical protein [Verrucomicrobiota bacterium]MDP7177480.1 hypothetical protein [Verrucomicrobiota bacterium]MDP7291343.1 hypothetical protein [Verrucomicrobiota bacterium]MDP7441083.1 hypothetical protein [Verrucomicrobiota bacterium]
MTLFTTQTCQTLLGLLVALPLARAESPDIHSIEPDLMIPKLEFGQPKAGKRVKQTIPDYENTHVYHVTYLPTDWINGERYPVLIEYAGNQYRGAYGDISTGRPEGSKMGYGISGGRGFVWVCLPYLTADKNDIAVHWWGDSKNRTAQPTLDYCKKAVPWICEKYGGDPDRVILCGFSRGAIACNYLGLYDNEIAKLWRAFIPYSHYDGIAAWPYPASDRDSALARLKRLAKRPQFICHENTVSKLNLAATKQWIESTGIKANLTFAETGFRNHSDAWLLRDSPIREQLRAWLERSIK